MVGEVGLRAGVTGSVSPVVRTDRDRAPPARSAMLERISAGLDLAGLDSAGAKDVAAALKSAKDGFQSQGKEIARQKVELIKERIKALKLIARADPQAVARLAARLAKELDAAVKSYVEAGGTAAIAAGASVPAPAAGSGPDAPAPDRPELAPPTAQTLLDDGSGAEVDAEAPSTTPSGDTGDGDRAFINLARDLLKDLEKVLETARHHLSLTGNRDADRDVEEADKAIRETAKSLDHLAASLPPPTLRVDVLA